MTLTFSDLTVREVHKLANERKVKVNLRVVYKWAKLGRLGRCTGFSRQGRTYSRDTVDEFLADKLEG